MRKNGFSLMEILVVIGIITLLSLIAIPLLLNYQRTTKLKSESRVLAINLRLAQQLSVTEQKIYYLKLFPETKTYQIINSETSQINKQVELDQEVSINEINGFPNNTIRFNVTGGVLESGYVTLINTKNEVSTIHIKPSGYVEIND